MGSVDEIIFEIKVCSFTAVDQLEYQSSYAGYSGFIKINAKHNGIAFTLQSSVFIRGDLKSQCGLLYT